MRVDSVGVGFCLVGVAAPHCAFSGSLPAARFAGGHEQTGPISGCQRLFTAPSGAWRSEYRGGGRASEPRGAGTSPKQKTHDAVRPLADAVRPPADAVGRGAGTL